MVSSYCKNYPISILFYEQILFNFYCKTKNTCSQEIAIQILYVLLLYLNVARRFMAVILPMWRTCKTPANESINLNVGLVL